MDNEFLALSLVFIILGATGIVLFNGSLTPSGDSCYCIIPTPEPGAAQGTSSILLALGVMFFPMGLMKGGPPTFRRGAGLRPVAPAEGGRPVSPVQILSGRFFLFGLIVLLIGVNVLIPAFLVSDNLWFELAGVLLTAAGVIAAAGGLRKPKAP